MIAKKKQIHIVGFQLKVFENNINEHYFRI